MTKRMIVATLALAGIFVALYLLFYKLGIIGNLSCSVGSCETVNLSKWATFLGAPVAAWGVGFYIVMFAAASNDLIAKWLTASVLTTTWVFRILLFVVPPIVGYVTYLLMRALAASGANRFTQMPLRALIDARRRTASP